MRILRRLFIPLLLILVFSCNISDTSSSNSVTVSVDAGFPTRSVPSVSYLQLSGTHSSGRTLEAFTYSSGSTLELAVGTWELLLNAYDSSDNLLYTGSITETLSSSTPVSLTILLDVVSGTSNIDITINWEAVDNPLIAITFAPVSTTGSVHSTLIDTLISTDTTYIYSVTGFDTGIYSVGYVLYSGADEISSNSDELYVYPDISVSKVINLSSEISKMGKNNYIFKKESDSGEAFNFDTFYLAIDDGIFSSYISQYNDEPIMEDDNITVSSSTYIDSDDKLPVETLTISSETLSTFAGEFVLDYSSADGGSFTFDYGDETFNITGTFYITDEDVYGWDYFLVENSVSVIDFNDVAPWGYNLYDYASDITNGYLHLYDLGTIGTPENSILENEPDSTPSVISYGTDSFTITDPYNTQSTMTYNFLSRNRGLVTYNWASEIYIDPELTGMDLEFYSGIGIFNFDVYASGERALGTYDQYVENELYDSAEADLYNKDYTYYDDVANTLYNIKFIEDTPSYIEITDLSISEGNTTANYHLLGVKNDKIYLHIEDYSSLISVFDSAADITTPSIIWGVDPIGMVIRSYSDYTNLLVDDSGAHKEQFIDDNINAEYAATLNNYFSITSTTPDSYFTFSPIEQSHKVYNDANILAENFGVIQSISSETIDGDVYNRVDIYGKSGVDFSDYDISLVFDSNKGFYSASFEGLQELAGVVDVVNDVNGVFTPDYGDTITLSIEIETDIFSDFNFMDTTFTSSDKFGMKYYYDGESSYNALLLSDDIANSMDIGGYRYTIYDHNTDKQELIIALYDTDGTSPWVVYRYDIGEIYLVDDLLQYLTNVDYVPAQTHKEVTAEATVGEELPS